ncbi:hypothetical protein A6U97_23955 [Agrobacterium tumefaciens]|nr:hypothetical protein A6U96_15540 [Agrobacterium tumefaciens]OCJ66921.1 hypothetical protein A6U97_23955 [Agrobacterium tumefaciens]
MPVAKTLVRNTLVIRRYGTCHKANRCMNGHDRISRILYDLLARAIDIKEGTIGKNCVKRLQSRPVETGTFCKSRQDFANSTVRIVMVPQRGNPRFLGAG